MAKKITSRAQLVGGQFYIRAFVNCHGTAFVEVVQIAGKPYRHGGDYDFLKNEFVVDQIINPFRGQSRKQYFTSDLGAESNREELALFPFSNKLILRLKELKKDKRKFAEFLNGRQFTEEEWEHAEWHWKSERDFDDTFQWDGF